MIKKKLTAIAVIIVIVVGLLPVSASYIDVKDEILSGKIETLEQLGILNGYDDATYRPAEDVTRGEFAVYASQLFNIKPLEGENYFSDVDGNAEYAGYVNALADNGMISIASDKFYPENNITYAEAVKVILAGMGYTPACEIQGGFPEGYIKMASRIGLGNATISNLTRKDMAVLFYNTLLTGVMEFSGLSGSEADYKVSDTLMMKEFHGLVQIKGIMNYNGITSIDGSISEAQNYVMIDGVKVECEEGVSYNEYLGYNVTVFAYEDESDNMYTVKALVPTADKNNIINISAENIESVTNATAIRVRSDSSYKNYNLSHAAIIYNDEYCASYNDALLMPKEGFLRLIDNNKDNRYEIAMVYDTIDDIVSGINTSLQVVYLENYGGVNLLEKEVAVYIDGKLRTFADIVTGYTASVAIGRVDTVTLWLSSNSYTGVLSGTDTEYINIEGQTYPVSAYFGYDTGDISLGRTYTAHISWFGKAVRLTSAEKSDKYGWLMNILYEDEVDAPTNVRFKILSETGAIERFNVGEKVYINDISYEIDLRKFQMYGLFDSGFDCIPQLVKYHTDDVGNILRIYTATDKTADGIYEEGFSLDKRVRNISTRMYRYNIGINYHLGAATKIFYLPLESEIEEATEEDYAVGSTGSFSQDVTYSNFDIYDTRSDRTAGVLVIRRSINPARVTDKLTDALMKRDLGVIVKSKVENTGDGNEAIVTMLSGGKEITIKAQSGDLPNSTQDSWAYSQMTIGELKRGDVILYSRSEQNEISDFTIIFRAEELEDKVFYERTPSNVTIDSSNDAALTPLHTVFGEVYDINSNTYSINITLPPGASPKPNQMRHLTANTSGYVYIMDYETGKWQSGALSDICKGDVVFMRAYNYVPQQIVVFRGI